MLQKDYERASAIDTVSAYEAFIRKHPDSEYTTKVTERLQALRESRKLEDLQREKAQTELILNITRKIDELAKVNFRRIKKLNNYAIGKVTLATFLNDGWTLEDPYEGQLGIIGILHDKDSRTKKTVDIIMGFTYRSLGREDKPALDPLLLKQHNDALKNELSNLKQDNVNIQTNILPLGTDKTVKSWTKKEWDLHGGPQALEPFFESTAVVTFDEGILKSIDQSGIKYINLERMADLDVAVYRCTITNNWLERTAGMSTIVPPPTSNDILQVFSARGLDKIQIDYKPKDEANLKGAGMVSGEKHPYLITKELVTYLPMSHGESALIDTAVFDRSSGKLRLDFDLPQGKRLTVDYLCEQDSRRW